MSEDSSVDRDEERSWLSIGTLTGWLWERTFTPVGLVVLALCSIAGALYVSRVVGKPSLVLFFPVVTLIILFFFWLITFVSAFGDMFAAWSIEKLLRHPTPRHPLHQLLYLLLSSLGFVIAAFIFGVGDGEERIRGYWRH